MNPIKSKVVSNWGFRKTCNVLDRVILTRIKAITVSDCLKLNCILHDSVSGVPTPELHLSRTCEA
jgi:hypothetical protein